MNINLANPQKVNQGHNMALQNAANLYNRKEQLFEKSTVKPPSYFLMAEYVIYLIVAIGFAMAPFRRSFSCDTWARWTFFTIAGFFIILGVCGFIIGCSFALLVSGNLFGKRILKEKVN